MNRFCQIIALWGALIGSIMLSLNLSFSGYGYLFFLASSIASVQVLLQSNCNKAMLQQQLVFIVVNCVGIYRWII